MAFAGIAVVVAGGGIAEAAIPSHAGQVTACYSAANPALRAVDSEAGKTCAAGETTLNLNTGPVVHWFNLNKDLTLAASSDPSTVLYPYGGNAVFLWSYSTTFDATRCSITATASNPAAYSDTSADTVKTGFYYGYLMITKTNPNDGVNVQVACGKNS